MGGHGGVFIPSRRRGEPASHGHARSTLRFPGIFVGWGGGHGFARRASDWIVDEVGDMVDLVGRGSDIFWYGVCVRWGKGEAVVDIRSPQPRRGV